MLKFQVETKGIQEQPLITHGVLLALLCSEIWFIPLAVSSISKQRFRLSRHSLDYGVIPHPHTSLEPIHQHETKRMYLVTIWNFKMLHTQAEKQNKPKKKKTTQNKNTSRKGGRAQANQNQVLSIWGHRAPRTCSEIKVIFPSLRVLTEQELKSPWWISFQAEVNFVLTLY